MKIEDVTRYAHAAQREERGQVVAATIIEDLRRESLDAQRLERAEHDHDFSALVTTIIEDLETLVAKYKGLLQALDGGPEPVTRARLERIPENETMPVLQGENCE